MKKNRSTISAQIQWHEGMALSPHHFQQSDLRIYQFLAHHLNLISFHHWGIQDLLIDQSVLPEGLYRVISAEIAMRDGLVFDYQLGVDDVLLEIDLKPSKPESSNEILTVNLVVPGRVAGTSPITAAIPRFRSIPGLPVNDENTDDNPIIIQRLLPCLKLHVGNALPAQHSGFPIAKIKFVDNAFKLVDYTPPCFQVLSDSHLWKYCAEMGRIIREKSQSLSEKWQNRVGTSLLRETADMLKPLVSVLPVIESMISSCSFSPAELYGSLMRTAGQVSQLHLSNVPPFFLPYNHNEIDMCITPIIDYIISCVENLSLEYAILPFKKDGRVFSFKLSSAYFNFDKKLYVGLRAPQGIQVRQIEAWMNDAVVVSNDAIKKVQTQRVTGAKRSLLDGDKLFEMSPPRDVTLFCIEIEQQFIFPDQYLHIFNPSDDEYSRPVDIVLYFSKDEKQELLDVA